LVFEFSEPLSLVNHWSPIDVNQQDCIGVRGCLVYCTLDILGGLKSSKREFLDIMASLSVGFHAIASE